MVRGIILLSAGGTGGHLFPAEALAHVLIRRGWEIHLVTDARAERYASNFPATAIHAVSSATLAGRNPAALVRGFFALWRGFRQSAALIAQLKPGAVVGFGGYPTIPPLFAAIRRGVPSLIHEQNAVMGRANRALAPRVSVIARGFPEDRATGLAARTVITGNPVRPTVLEAAARPYEVPSADGPFRLLVFGGSQGAQFFARIIPEALSRMVPAFRQRIRLNQQARPEDEAELRSALAALDIEAEISPFFSDLAARMAEAHLVISRAGASTVSELCVIGRPALLVPYPHALDHDQTANAGALARAGGAKVCPQGDLDAARLADLIVALMHDPDRLVRMAAAAKAIGRPDASELLADCVEAIASGMSIAKLKAGVEA
jgi:UDP-N-acetylglucosamine--N-acetylmuramyl-(pentapeptide) pyrophosphoryl-undecaprenol N-acetylglucosamine transferase